MSKYTDSLKDPRWQKKRLEVFNRDNFTCQMCNSTTNTLVVHHFKYNGEPWDIDSKHLLTICESCHAEEHKFRQSEEDDFIKILKEKSFTVDLISWLRIIFESSPLTADEITFVILNTIPANHKFGNFFESIQKERRDFWIDEKDAGAFLNRIYKVDKKND